MEVYMKYCCTLVNIIASGGELFTKEELESISHAMKSELSEVLPTLKHVLTKDLAWSKDADISKSLKKPLLRLCARYLKNICVSCLYINVI